LEIANLSSKKAEATGTRKKRTVTLSVERRMAGGRGRVVNKERVRELSGKGLTNRLKTL